MVMRNFPIVSFSLLVLGLQEGYCSAVGVGVNPSPGQRFKSSTHEVNRNRQIEAISYKDFRDILTDDTHTNAEPMLPIDYGQGIFSGARTSNDWAPDFSIWKSESELAEENQQYQQILKDLGILDIVIRQNK